MSSWWGGGAEYGRAENDHVSDVWCTAQVKHLTYNCQWALRPEAIRLTPMLHAIPIEHHMHSETLPICAKLMNTPESARCAAASHSIVTLCR